jgi:hypothetical protein
MAIESGRHFDQWMSSLWLRVALFVVGTVRF